MSKVAELEMDRNEHRLVEETLGPLDSDRRAYRLVGEVLVERTVGEVLPSVKSNRENVSRIISVRPYLLCKFSRLMISVAFFLPNFFDSVVCSCIGRKLEKTIAALRERLTTKQRETAEFKVEYKLQ